MFCAKKIIFIYSFFFLYQSFGIDSLSTFSNLHNEVRFSWTSSVNQTYSIISSTDLVEEIYETNTIHATPPFNQWWKEMNNNAEFFKLIQNQVTNIPPSSINSSITNNIIVNGTFDNNLSGWAVPQFQNGASGNASVQNGELFFDIQDAGSQRWNIFFRQLNLNLINGYNYTLKFKARVSDNRRISLVITSGDGSLYYLNESNIDISQNTQLYSFNFNMSQNTDSSARLSFNLGEHGRNDNNSEDNISVYLDDIELIYSTNDGEQGNMRLVAYERNRRLGRGNNFMAAKAIQGHGRLQDYELLNQHHFNHCRIGYKMDEKAASSSPYTIPIVDMTHLKNMVDWCNQMGLIAIIDPIHNWMADDSAGGPFDQSLDLEKLSNIWIQVATEFADYDLENVFFEIANEPRSYHNAQEIISTGLSAIRGISGNETRMVIICGDGFSTRQALIDEFDNNNIPIDDNYLIGTFHYYDPFDFTKQGAADRVPGISWGSDSEFQLVETHFDQVVAANNNWAARNNTQPLPIYLGEFGVDNEADNHHTDRKKWLSWIRMQAEKRGFSWAHWNMYSNIDTAKGMGPWEWSYWQTTQPNNMTDRYFDSDPVEALVGRYEFEDGNQVGNVQVANYYPGYSGNSYVEFLANEPNDYGSFSQINSIYLPKNDIYKINIHYAANTNHTLRLVSKVGENQISSTNVLFNSTGSLYSWDTREIELEFENSETNSLRLVSPFGSSDKILIDWLHISQ